MNKKHVILVLGLCVTVVAFVYSTRGVNFADFKKAFAGFRLIWLLPGLAAFYYSMYLRAVRWGLLFRPHHDLKGRDLFRPMMIGFAFNSILPARVGEFVRAIYVGKRLATGISTAFATVLAERIFDGLLLLGLLALSLWLLPPLASDLSFTFGDWTLTAGMLNDGIRKIIIASAILTVGVVVFMIPWVQLTLIRVIRRLHFLSGGLRGALEQLVGQFARGFHALSRPATLVQLVVQSIVIWLLVAVSNLAVAYGFALPLNFLQSMALVTLIGIFILIPAAPGYWGLYEAGTIFSLLLMGVTTDRSLALAYALMIHLLQYVPIVVVGLFFAWQSQVRADVATTPAPEPTA